MVLNMRFFLVFMVLVFSTNNVLAANYYISKNGRDSNSGSEAAPWRSILQANKSLQAGDTVFIKAGVYDDVIEPYISGLRNNRITYKNYGTDVVTIRGISGDMPVVAIGSKINGNSDPKSFITVEGFNIKNKNPLTKNHPNIYIIGGGSRENIIRNCSIVNDQDVLSQGKANLREMGITISGAVGTLIEGNKIKGLSGQGVKLKNNATLTKIKGNTIIDNYFDSIRVDSSKFKLQGTLIEENILGGSMISDGIQTSPNFDLAPEVFALDTSNQGIVIRNNVIINNQENAIDVKGTSYVVIEGNIIYGTRGDNDGFLGDGVNDRNSSMAIMHGRNASSKDVIIRNNVLYDNYGGVLVDNGYKIYNNTIVGNNRDYTGSNSTYVANSKPSFLAIDASKSSLTRASIKNNILGNSNVSTISLNVNAKVEINGNVYTNTSIPKFVIYRSKSDWDSHLFAEWKTALSGLGGVTGRDNQSSVTNPMMVNVPLNPVGSPSSLNFNIKSKNHGVFLTTTRTSGSGTNVPIIDAGYFFDGYGVTNGDQIIIGNNNPVNIIAVNYGTNNITLDQSIVWNKGDGISLTFKGVKLEVGAIHKVPDNPTGQKITLN